MELTVQMVEEVFEATGADYKTVKQALTDHDGDVQAAISAIQAMKEEEAAAEQAAEEAVETEETAAEEAEEEAEAGETADSTEDAEGSAGESRSPFDSIEEAIDECADKVDDYAGKVVDILKKRVEEGNVDRIRILSREGNTILDIPVALGVIGGIFGMITIPWAMIVGVIAAYGLKCKVEIISSDGNSEEM